MGNKYYFQMITSTWLQVSEPPTVNPSSMLDDWIRTIQKYDVHWKIGTTIYMLRAIIQYHNYLFYYIKPNGYVMMLDKIKKTIIYKTITTFKAFFILKY